MLDGYTWGWDNGRALIGIVLIYAFCWAISANRKALPWKIILGATILQFSFAFLFFGVPKLLGLGGTVEGGDNPVVKALVDATRYATSFVYGYVGDNTLVAQPFTPFTTAEGLVPPSFFFQILPLIIVVAALSAMLWHWGILKWITNAFAFIFRRTMGISGPTSLAVSANVFMGMTEAPLLIRPYLKSMTRSELLIMMTAGFATIAGSVMVVYATMLDGKLPDPITQLFVASMIAAPAAVSVALTLIPETETSRATDQPADFQYPSTMDAFSTGATDGLKIVFNIATMLIAALALLYLVNEGFKAVPDVAGAPLSIERILGWIFAPLMYMIGVPLEEAAKSGGLMGVKTVLTEFVAFIQLANVPLEDMDPRTRMITAHAVCGFANFGSVGILLGGLSIMEPERRDDFMKLAWHTLLAGTLATCLSGAVVASLPYELFARG
ncbi:nucleoside transporter C-terminal domain-containing protein [Hyphomonas sp.]|uniref:NupC/NupG family nucleoside CNT transporter n=1 Tax=Hyphomonas sp. TaxID=87 RepID=UPI0033411266